MFANLKKADSTTIPMSHAPESQYVTLLAEKQAMREKTARFRYLARNKNLPPIDLAGPIMEKISENGAEITVFTTVSVEDALKFQSDKFLMYLFN